MTIDYVYFMQMSEDGPIKIGHGINIKKRLIVAQVYNPYMLTIICITEGGRKKEAELHKIFAEDRIYGEWFLPSEKLLNYISQFEKINMTSESIRPPKRQGKNSQNWKGENVLRSTKLERARKILNQAQNQNICTRCKKQNNLLDTWFKDGNINNLTNDNICKLCRRCRMELDGTLSSIIEFVKQKNKNIIRKQTECKICKKYVNSIRRGRCHTCNEYYRRNGTDHRKYEEKQPTHCVICKKLVGAPALGKCRACYEFFRRNGVERSEKERIVKENRKTKSLIRCIFCNSDRKIYARQACTSCYDKLRANKLSRIPILG